MSRRVPEWLSRAGLVLAGVAAALLISEAGLRLAGVGYPVFSQPDDDRGWSLRPGAQGRHTSEGDSWVLINHDGWRDRDHTRVKPPGTLRIAVLGDSYTEALEVPVEDTFWAVLERELAGEKLLRSRSVEVINFGVRGYGTAQELLTLRCCVWDYQPDVVLLAFYPSNDLRDNVRALDRTSTNYARPYFLGTPETWVIDRSFRGTIQYRITKVVAPLVAHSRVLQLLVRARHLRFRQNAISPETPEGIPPTLTVGQDVYREPRDSVWKTAWRTTEDLVRTMAREVRQRGARFGTVIVTAAVQVYPDSLLREGFARGLGISDFGLPARRLEAVGQEEGFPILDLAPELQDYADRNRAFLHGFPNRRLGIEHWNQLGHRLAGERIARWLAEWLPL